MTLYHQTQAEINEDADQVRMSQNNPQAFGFLYQKYHKSIFLYLFRACGQEEDAADMCTEVFCKALLHLKKYENRGLPFSAWLYKIALNELYDYQRKKKRNLLLQIDFQQAKEMVDDIPLNEDAWLRCLTKSMQALKIEEYHLLQFRFNDDKSFREIGSILNLSEENAKTKTYRVFKKLKPLIQHCYAKIQGH